MESVKVTVEGLEQIDRQLAQLPIELRERTLRRAVTLAAAAGRKNARRAAPRGNGVGGDPDFPDLAGSVRSKTVVKREVVIGIVGTAPAATQAHLVEYGHRMVIGGTIASGKNNRVRKAADPNRTGKGRVVGTVAARPWFRPSYDASKPEIEKILLDELQALIPAGQ